MKITLFSPDNTICAAWRRENKGLHDVIARNASLENLAPHTAIVTAGNSYGVMTGGIDCSARNLFGQGVQDQIQDYIMGRRALINVGEAIAVEVNHEIAEHVIYAPTMITPQQISDYEVCISTFAAICCAVNIGCESVAIPAMGMGVGGVEPQAVARAMRLAIEAARKFKEVTV